MTNFRAYMFPFFNWWKSKTNSTQGTLLAGIIGVLICQSWFRWANFIGTGDNAPLIGTSRSIEMGSLFNHELSGAGSVSYLLGHLYDVVWYNIATGVGISDTLTQRIYVSVWVGLMVGATAWMIAGWVNNKVIIISGGLFSLLNPFMITHLPNMLVLVQLTVMSAILGIAIRAANPNRKPSIYLWAAVGLLAAPLVYNAPQLIVIFGWTVIVTPLLVWSKYGLTGLKRTSVHLLKGLPLAVGVSIWWIVALVLTVKDASTAGTVSAQTDIVGWSWTHINNNIINIADLSANHAWGKAQYYPVTLRLSEVGFTILRLVAPLLVLASPWLVNKKYRRSAITIVILTIGLIFIGKGLHAPLTDVNIWLYRNMPGMWVIREPFGKLGPVNILIYSISLSLVGQQVWQRYKKLKPTTTKLRIRKAGITAAASAAAIAILVSATPLFTGTVVPTERITLPSSQVQIPQEWYTIAETLNNSEYKGKTLTLPLDDYYQMPTNWGYYGVNTIPASLLNHPVASQNPGGYFSDPPGYTALLQNVETVIKTGQTAQLPTLLSRLGVSNVIWRHDLDTEMFNYRTFTDPEELANIDTAPGLTKIMATNVADVYQVVGENMNKNGNTNIGILDGSVNANTGVATNSEINSLGVGLGNVGGNTGVELGEKTANPYATDVISGLGTTLGQGGTLLFNNATQTSVTYKQQKNRLVTQTVNHIEVNGQKVNMPNLTMKLNNDKKISLIKIGNTIYPKGSEYLSLISGKILQTYSDTVTEWKIVNNEILWNSDENVTSLYVTTNGETPTTICETETSICENNVVVNTGANSWGVWIKLNKPVKKGSLTIPEGQVNSVNGLTKTGEQGIVLPTAGRMQVTGEAKVAWVGPEKVTLGPWEKAGNCNDDGSVAFENTGIEANITGNGVQVQAIKGSGCTKSVINVEGGGRTFLLHGQAKATGNGAPRVCVYLQPQRQCVRLTPGWETKAVDGYLTLNTSVTLPENTRSAELYIYADSSLGPTSIEYKNMYVSPILNAGAAVVPNGVVISNPGETTIQTLPVNPDVTKVSSSEWEVNLKPEDSNKILRLTDRYSVAWVLEGVPGVPVALDGYAQGWKLGEIKENVTVKLVFKLNTINNIAMSVSAVCIGMLLWFSFVGERKTKIIDRYNKKFNHIDKA